MIVYSKTFAAEFYTDIRTILSERMAVSEAYVRLNRVFLHLLDEHTAQLPIHLVGPFAKTDYLLKKYKVPKRIWRMVNDLRVRLNRFKNRELPAEEQNRMLADDTQALSLFVQHLYGIPIPEGLVALFPAKRQRQSRQILLAECVRMIVDKWDADFIWGRLESDGVEEACVCYSQGNENYPFDWSYLTPLLKPGMQLHLIRPQINKEGTLYPELIILEPDYLVDASSLAECYKNYGAHPANYLMSRLTPSENTIPLLLGNIANTFLDECIYNDDPDYKESMVKAFRQHPVSISACTDLQDTDKERAFAQDCVKHFRNIQQTVTVTFRESGYQLNKADAVLEPSYICEALGIQGRLDYMQRDMHAFIEMKSGKADEYTMPGHVLPRENNLMQMLLAAEG